MNHYEYLVQDSSYGETAPKSCEPWDVICRYQQWDASKKDALSRTIEIPQTDPKVLGALFLITVLALGYSIWSLNK